MKLGRVLVTGGAGFIGSNFIQLLLNECDVDKVINVDALTYAGNLANLQAYESDDRYTFYKARIEDKSAMTEIFEAEKPTIVFHFAAESHVDRSIMDGRPFIISNVLGTQTLLDCARSVDVDRFVHVSTDEVYGSLGDEGVFTEETPLDPSSPYSASKTASDVLVQSYFRTHNFPTIITRCSNNYGPYQFPEKLIPLMISNALNDKALPVYGDGLNVRDWIYVDDHCRGVLASGLSGNVGEVYHFGGNAEVRNIDIVKRILGILDKPESLITYVKDRPGHDYRYAMGIEKSLKELDWAPRVGIDDGLAKTVEWYLSNQAWWEAIKSGAYMDYYAQQYGNEGDAV